MKKIIAALICVIMICAAAVPAFAGQNDDVFKNAAVGLLVDLDSFEENNGFQMRGFTASPDGKYVYGGFLQNYRHVTKIDTATGEHVAEYAPEVENDEYPGVTADNNYPKGLAVDCRGYLFVGITHDVPHTSYISIACVDTTPDEDGFMTELSVLTEDLDTERVGVNGVCSVKIDDRILLYVVTGYEKDTIRCYDVTDINNMKLYEGFGVNGVVDYNSLTGQQSDPGYIAVDVDGYLYLCYKQDGSSYSKGSHVIKIDKDGKSILEQVEIPQAYGICTAGDYLFVSTYNDADSKVVVLNKSDLSFVADLVYEDQINSLSGCCYGGDCLYIGDHGDGTSGLPGTVLRTTSLNLTRDPRELETVKVDPVVKPDETTAEPTPEPEGSFTLLDFSNPNTVAKLSSGNDCELEYDEENACLKVTVTGSDPYFSLPMKKEAWFDGDKFPILVLNYKTACEDTNGEIFFTSKDAREIAKNHLSYYMEAAENFTDLEIDMTEDDYGNWGGEIRSLRLDPSITDDEDQVFYIKSVSFKEAENIPDTEPQTTEEEKTNTEEQTGTEPEATEPTTTDKPADTEKDPGKTTKDGPNAGLIIGIIAAAVVVCAAVVLIIVKAKKKK